MPWGRHVRPVIRKRSRAHTGPCLHYFLAGGVGLIVRINQRTATLDCDGQTWHVFFGLLSHLVDV